LIIGERKNDEEKLKDVDKSIEYCDFTRKRK
jgi:hypothetical protein